MNSRSVYIFYKLQEIDGTDKVLHRGYNIIQSFRSDHLKNSEELCIRVFFSFLMEHPKTKFLIIFQMVGTKTLNYVMSSMENLVGCIKMKTRFDVKKKVVKFCSVDDD